MRQSNCRLAKSSKQDSRPYPFLFLHATRGERWWCPPVWREGVLDGLVQHRPGGHALLVVFLSGDIALLVKILPPCTLDTHLIRRGQPCNLEKLEHMALEDNACKESEKADESRRQSRCTKSFLDLTVKCTSDPNSSSLHFCPGCIPRSMRQRYVTLKAPTYLCSLSFHKSHCLLRSS